MEGYGSPRMMTQKAKSLSEELAEQKDTGTWMTWVQVPLGSVQLNSVGVADVLAVRKSFTNPNFIIYEVKVTRSDFLSDVNQGKYRRYFPDCCQLYFAAPAGLIKKEELPEGTGLIVRGENGWHVTKAAPRREHNPDPELLLKLLMRGYENQLVQWKQYDRIKNLEYKDLKDASRAHGIRIGSELAQASEIIAQAEELLAEIETVLGKKYGTLLSASYQLQRDIRGLLQQREYAPVALQLAQLTMGLFEGSYYLADGIPNQLRTIAGALETKLSQQKEGTP